MTLAELQKERAGMLDPLDIPGDWTERMYDAYEARRAFLDWRIRTIRQALADLAKLPTTDADEEWLGFLNSAEATLCDELLALPPRDKRAHNVQLSIETIRKGLPGESGYSLATLRLGELMREAGYRAAPPVNGEMWGRMPWLGDQRAVNRRIADLTKRREAAQAMLDEALLDDEARAQLTAERAAQVKERNAQPQLKTRGDGSQFLKYPDGRTEEVSV